MRLTREDLERHDPRSRMSGGQQRFLCPLSQCSDHQRAHHRSMSVEPGTGLYYCHRCGAGGVLADMLKTRRERVPRVQVRQTVRLASNPRGNADLEDMGRIGDLIDLAPDGITYMRSRGLALRECVAAGVRYSDTWAGKPAVLFPLRDEEGRVIALQARFLRPQDGKVITRGPKSLALFQTPGALSFDRFAITEAPIDALSLYTCGLPSVAMCGATAPAWLRRWVLGKEVLIATDADGSGDEAAELVAAELSAFGAISRRLRPPEGCKDWNDALTASLIWSGHQWTDQMAPLTLPTKS